VKVQGFVKNAEVERLKHFEDGSYQIMMRMPLCGASGLTAAILPVQLEKVRKVRTGYEISRGAGLSQTTPDAEATKEPIEKAPSGTEAENSETQQQEDTEQPAAEEQRQSRTFTGLIVDALELNIKPALYPRILTEDGEVVYDLQSADPNATVEEGLVDYRKSLAEAKKAPRVGDNPLVVKATQASGKYKTDIVISKADATSLYQNGKNILREARVVVVTE
jgi:hypothetical protein